MPQVSLTKTGGSIIFNQEDWLGGLNTNATTTDLKKSGIVSMAGVSPLRNPGYLSPSPLPNDVTNVSQVTAYLRNAVNIGDNAYLIGSNSLVHKLSVLAAGTISTTSPFPHIISHGGHSSPAGSDIVIYYTGTTQRVFYSFSDANDWDVGIYNVVADTFDDDFMSTVPANPLGSPYLTGGASFPHPMVVGDDDILYIGDRNFVHAYDGQTGANGTFYPAVLTLPQGYIITSFTTTQDINLAIGAYVGAAASSSTYHRGTAKVWFWNYLALDPDYSRDLRDNYVSEIVQWSGTIAAFTSGRKTVSDAGANKLQALNGSQFEVVQTWTSGNLPIRGGVDNVSNDLYWNSESRIYSFTRRPDSGEYTFNIISTAPGGSSGLLKFFTATSRIHYSWGASTSGGLQYLLTNNSEGGVLQTQIIAPEFPIRQRGRLTAVTIAFGGTFTGGRSFELATFVDGSANLTTGEIPSLTSTRSVVFTTNANGTPLGDFNYLAMQVGFPTGAGATAAPLLSWVRYDFELINVVNPVVT